MHPTETDPATPHSALERLVTVLNALADSSEDGPEASIAAIREALGQYGDIVDGYFDDAVAMIGRSALSMAHLFDDHDIAAASIALNRILAATSATPRLSNHSGERWHLHVDTEPFEWDSWFRSASALSMAVTLSEHGRIPWGRCARPGCDRVFSGLGRGAAQVYCSNRCGSRVRMAKLRAQSSGSPRLPGTAQATPPTAKD